MTTREKSELEHEMDALVANLDRILAIYPRRFVATRSRFAGFRDEVKRGIKKFKDQIGERP